MAKTLENLKEYAHNAEMQLMQIELSLERKISGHCKTPTDNLVEYYTLKTENNFT